MVCVCVEIFSTAPPPCYSPATWTAEGSVTYSARETSGRWGPGLAPWHCPHDASEPACRTAISSVIWRRDWGGFGTELKGNHAGRDCRLCLLLRLSLSLLLFLLLCAPLPPPSLSTVTKMYRANYLSLSLSLALSLSLSLSRTHARARARAHTHTHTHTHTPVSYTHLTLPTRR